MDEGRVACRHLGFFGKQWLILILGIIDWFYYTIDILEVFEGAHFGEGDDIINSLDNVECIGNETSIFDCQHTTYYGCLNKSAVGIRCSSELLYVLIINHDTWFLQNWYLWIVLVASILPLLLFTYEQCYIYMYILTELFLHLKGCIVCKLVAARFLYYIY